MAREFDGRRKEEMSRPVLSTESTSGLKPNPRYQHAFAIIRIDEYSDPETPIEHRITVKKIVLDAEDAEREVERLNRLRAGKRGRYFSQITRIETPDESRVGAAGGYANRITAFLPEGSSGAIAAEKLAELESIFVPHFVHHEPPQGFGFPAIRAYEVCANPSSKHLITWEIFRIALYARRQKGFTDVVGIEESQGVKKLMFGLRAFPDLCKEPLEELSPVDIVQRIVDRFGLTVSVGGSHEKFFREQEIHVPTLMFPGVTPGHVISFANPRSHDSIPSFLVAVQPPVIRIAMAFALDLTEYWSWIKSHGGIASIAEPPDQHP
jgi:hypothetical protein